MKNKLNMSKLCVYNIYNFLKSYTLRNRTKFAIATPPPPPPDIYPFLSHRVSLESFMGRTGIFITFQIMIIAVDYFYDFCSDKNYENRYTNITL